MVSFGKIFGSKSKKSKRPAVPEDEISQPTIASDTSVISPLRQLLDGTFTLTISLNI
jgi:hypothetical protein